MAIRSFLILLLLVALTGCTQGLNDRPTLGGSYLSPTFRQHTDNHTAIKNPAQHLLTTTSKPRAEWTPTQYISPMDSVVHLPTLTLYQLPKKTDLPRIYGRYPTTNSALYMQKSAPIAWINDALITFYDLGRSFIGAPYALGYLAVTGKLTDPVESPAQSYKRTETANTWSSGFPTQQETTEEPADE